MGASTGRERLGREGPIRVILLAWILNPARSGGRSWLQSGIVARGQALGHGLDEDVMKRRLRAGRWRAVHRGVYATFSGRLSREAVLWAASCAPVRGGPQPPDGRRVTRADR